MKIVILAVLCATSLAFLSGSVNDLKWGKQLSGEGPIADEEIVNMYHDWLNEFERELTNMPEVMGTKFSNFKTTVNQVRAQNAKKSSWTAGLNQFSDMTDDEFMAYNSLDKPFDEQICSATERNSKPYKQGEERQPLKASFNWRDSGIVSDVKDQKNCGACWTFSTIGSLEAFANIALDDHRTDSERFHFSEQQLLECARAEFDNYGCMGGLPSHAFEYIKYSGGIATETDYPYFATDDAASCKWEWNEGTGANWDGDYLYTTGSFNITENDEAEAAYVLQEEGPVAVSYEVVSDFKNYQKGVYVSDLCTEVGPLKVNHAVLAVGFGTDENGLDYWEIKNSWGARWGDHGFFKMERNTNLCSIGVCNSIPENVEVVQGSR